MSKNERVISDPEAAGWEFDSDTGYWMWKGEEGTGGGLWTDNGGNSISYDGTVTVNGDLLAAKADAGANALSLGPDAGGVTQGAGSTALGERSGYTNQGDYAVAVGHLSGYDAQNDLAVAVGPNAGKDTQGVSAVALGHSAGEATQGAYALAVGANAGQTNQKDNAVSVGRNAGQTDQGYNSVAIGQSAGREGQKNNSVALGVNAASVNQGSSSIAIGFGAGQTDQAANGIIISATGNAENNSTPNHIELRSKTGSLKYNGTDTWQFSGGTVTGGGLRFESIAQDGSPVIDAKGLIKTLATLRKATMDETQDIRESLRDAIDELVAGFEQEIATMPAPEDS